jgi:hypothetical protein
VDAVEPALLGWVGGRTTLVADGTSETVLAEFASLTKLPLTKATEYGVRPAWTRDGTQGT